MKEKNEIREELESISKGFPHLRSNEPPDEYFDQLPGQVLNRWSRDMSYPKTKRISWKKIISVAAILSGLIIGMLLFIRKDNPPAPISSAEAYKYVHENIDEFESLLEYKDQDMPNDTWNLPSDAIHEYLMEETGEESIEELF